MILSRFWWINNIFLFFFFWNVFLWFFFHLRLWDIIWLFLFFIVYFYPLIMIWVFLFSLDLYIILLLFGIFPRVYWDKLFVYVVGCSFLLSLIEFVYLATKTVEFNLVSLFQICQLSGDLLKAFFLIKLLFFLLLW